MKHHISLLGYYLLHQPWCETQFTKYSKNKTIITKYVQNVHHCLGFVQILESPGVLLFRIPGLESPGKRHRSWKTMEIPGKSWNSKAALLDFLFLF